MPRTAAQLEHVREESRERILASALRLFARHGYAATSVRMIAAEAGISQGLLYNYYDGKEALLRAIFDRSMVEVRRSFERAEGGATPEERIERLIRAAFESVREDLGFWRLTYQLRMKPEVLEGVGGDVRAASEAILLHLEELLGEVEGGAAEVEARVLFGAIDGAAQHYALDPERYPLEAVAGALIRRFVPRNAGEFERPGKESGS